MNRTSRFAMVGALALMIGVVGVDDVPTGAATNPVTVTSSNPDRPLGDETVTVSGTNPAGGPVDLLECKAASVPPAGQQLDRTQCDSTNIRSGIQPDASGNFTTYFVFHLDFSTSGASPTSVDCSVAGDCAVVADANPPGDVVGLSLLEGVLSCGGVFDDRATSTFVKTTNPAGAASTQPTSALPMVEPGQTVTANLTWRNGDFIADLGLSLNNDCVQYNGSDDTSLDVVIDVGDTGAASASFTVPDSARTGDRICDRGVISGVTLSGLLELGLTEYSNIVCFQVGPPAVTPEVQWPISFVLAGGVVGGGAAFYLRRRARRVSPADA
jgi:hypothetical protein